MYIHLNNINILQPQRGFLLFAEKFQVISYAN